MPVCMTDTTIGAMARQLMPGTDDPPAPRFFRGAFSFPALRVSKPAAVSTTDDWRKTPAIPFKAMGERSEE